jgi:hypothetical protein
MLYNDGSMKKELFIAVIIGLLVGLVITYGIYRVRTGVPKQVTNTKTSGIEATDSATTDSTNLVLSSPEDESVQTSPDITIAGTTIPNSFVVIFINNKENITTADESGNFSITATLEAGSSIIRVHSVQEDGSTIETERTVIYLTDAFAAAQEATPAAKTSPTPTPKATTKATAKPTAKPATPKPSPTAQP